LPGLKQIIEILLQLMPQLDTAFAMGAVRTILPEFLSSNEKTAALGQRLFRGS
jgi:hypothetical protein